MSAGNHESFRSVLRQDDDTDDRIFFNIVAPRVDAITRFLDIDVKDIRLDEIDPSSEIAIELLNKDFLRYAEKVNLSKDLNDMARSLVTYGSLVLKIDPKGKPEIVDLKNFFIDPTVESVKVSRFTTIKHIMSPKEMRDKVKDGWDAKEVERMIERAGKKSTAERPYEDDGSINQILSSPQVEVYERYGFLPKKMIEGGKSEEEVMTLTITANPTDTTTIISSSGLSTTEENGAVLFKSFWNDDVPIIDTHYIKTEGRWQGLGVVELLYATQTRQNELANQKRISMEISALHLFQSADKTILNNILTDLRNGDVLRTKVQGSIAPIVNEERNLPAFNTEQEVYDGQADKLTSANDILLGGDVPSSTPATNVVVQNNNQVLIHLQKRENFANFISTIFIKPFVVPELIKDSNDEHFLRMVSEPEDILKIEEKMVALNFVKEVKRRAIEEGKVLDILEGEDLLSELALELKKSGPNRYTKVLKEYYRERLGDIIVHIDNEKKDIAKIANNTLQFFQLIQNPEALSDPVNRLLVTNYGKEIGIDVAKLEMAFARREVKAAEQPQEGGRLPQIEPQEDETEKQLAKVG